MSTGNQEIAFATKRLLGLTDFRDHFYAKLLADVREVSSLTFSANGVFGASPTALAADGADKFKLATFQKATDGLGHFMLPTTELGAAVKFENANAIVYFVALHYAQRPRGAQTNPRTGLPEIQYAEDTIGEQASPASVVASGAGLKFFLDNVCEPGVSHAGRNAVVWKTTPGATATSEAVAIETITIAWDGVNNTATSVANFGQGVAPSLVAADYQVVVLGPTVRQNTDLSATPGYAFIGRVTGAGAGNPPAVFTTAGQTVLDSSLAGLNQVTRVDVHGKLKVSVTADASDSGENQIEVRNNASILKFSVTEAGDVVIAGNLIVQGTETVNNTETLLTNEVIAGNLTVGDSDADAHEVKGIWTHRSAAAAIDFQVDGATGRVGIGAAQNGVDRLFVSGSARFTSWTISSTSTPVTDRGASLGTGALRFQDIVANRLNPQSIATLSDDNLAVFFGETGTSRFEMRTDFATTRRWRFHSLGQTAGRDAIVVQADGRMGFIEAAIADIDAPAKFVWSDNNTGSQTIQDSVDRAKIVVFNRDTGNGVKAGISLWTGTTANSKAALWAIYAHAAIADGLYASADPTKTTPTFGILKDGKVIIADGASPLPFSSTHSARASLDVVGNNTITRLDGNSIGLLNDAVAADMAILIGSRFGAGAGQLPTGNAWALGHYSVTGGGGVASKNLIFSVASNITPGSTTSATNASYLELQPGSTPTSPADSPGLAIRAGRSFDGGSVTDLQLVSLNQKKSIVAKANFSSAGVISAGAADENFNMATNAVVSGTSVYTITLVRPVALTAMLFANVTDSAGGFAYARLTGTGTVVVETRTTAGGLGARSFCVAIWGMPNTAP